MIEQTLIIRLLVRRRADGSIDIASYKERAQRLRWEAALKLQLDSRSHPRNHA